MQYNYPIMDKRHNHNNTETHRQCADCKHILPRTEFHNAKARHDGILPYCKTCFAKRNAAAYAAKKEIISGRRRLLKTECVQSLGGKCSRCGYNEFVSGLDFHHTADKENVVADLITKAATGNGKEKVKLMAELSKCVLLCRNCHSAYHANEWK